MAVSAGEGGLGVWGRLRESSPRLAPGYWSPAFQGREIAYEARSGLWILPSEVSWQAGRSQTVTVTGLARLFGCFSCWTFFGR